MGISGKDNKEKALEIREAVLEIAKVLAIAEGSLKRVKEELAAVLKRRRMSRRRRRIIRRIIKKEVKNGNFWKK